METQLGETVTPGSPNGHRGPPAHLSIRPGLNFYQKAQLPAADECPSCISRRWYGGAERAPPCRQAGKTQTRGFGKPAGNTDGQEEKEAVDSLPASAFSRGTQKPGKKLQDPTPLAKGRTSSCQWTGSQGILSGSAKHCPELLSWLPRARTGLRQTGYNPPVPWRLRDLGLCAKAWAPPSHVVGKASPLPVAGCGPGWPWPAAAGSP